MEDQVQDSRVNPGECRVGVAVVEITPPLFVNWVDRKPYTGVRDPIFLQAIAFECGGEKALILCFDLLEIRAARVKELREALEQRFGLPPAHVLFNASHTHSAPRFPFCREDTHPAHWEKLSHLLDHPEYLQWATELSAKVLKCAETAFENMRPAHAGIRRIYAGDWVYNRRPIYPDGSVVTDFSPRTPFAQPDGRRFGICDPTLTALRFSDDQGGTIASLLHFACHPVAIYPTDKRVSADWPGTLRDRVSRSEGGMALFLQGCAGDQVPIRRGGEAVDEMTDVLAARVSEAVGLQGKIALERIRGASCFVDLPLDPEIGNVGAGKTLCAEVQVLLIGEIALVALPGEPFIGLALEIQKRSPFAHTLCLGYSNGHGTAYVGLPIEKERGGYEATVSHGAPGCGTLLIEAACALLRQLTYKPPFESPCRT